MIKEIEKITKPIQLLAAIFLALISVDTLFLTSASKMAGFPLLVWILVIASVFNVYIFLFYAFKLQTQYRPQMQDDEYYAKYLQYTNPATGKEAGKELVEFVEHSKERDVINLNKLLGNYKEIHSLLEKNGIKIDKVFGIDRNDDPEELNFGIPPFNLITYGFGFDIDKFKKILELLVKISPADIYISHSIHAINKNTLYIGSYAYKSTNNYIRLSEDIRVKLIEKDISPFSIGRILGIRSIEQVGSRIVKKTPTTIYEVV